MIDLTGRVAIVTGAGGGLGREHALLLAGRGARVVVNDVGQDAADRVADEIRASGGTAIGRAASVTDFEAVKAMMDDTIGRWGQVDILINNAGILRDKTFAKMDLTDFRLVIDVHLMGSVNCTKAVWDHMRERNYGRIVMTTSSSGLYGNFGQSNYSAAKMALVGLMQTLALEGARYGIRVNCIAPSAATQMLDGLLPQEELDRLHPGLVSPGVLVLAGDDAPTRTILCGGAGSFEAAYVTLTQGTFFGAGGDVPEEIAAAWPRIIDRSGETIPDGGFRQSEHELRAAGYTRKAEARG
jgi:NAD(P)-dependent dehydrogenase (short-subunit alcohol dehydrogenase family)